MYIYWKYSVCPMLTKNLMRVGFPPVVLGVVSGSENRVYRVYGKNNVYSVYTMCIPYRKP